MPKSYHLDWLRFVYVSLLLDTQESLQCEAQKAYLPPESAHLRISVFSRPSLIVTFDLWPCNLQHASGQYRDRRGTFRSFLEIDPAILCGGQTDKQNHGLTDGTTRICVVRKNSTRPSCNREITKRWCRPAASYKLRIYAMVCELP